MDSVILRDPDGPLAPVVAALARFNSRHPWSHNDHFHGWIVRRLPDRRSTALEVGCGEGALASLLSDHVRAVHAIDVDAAMREATRRRCRDRPGVTVGDDDLHTLQGEYDVVTMVAVLHHLELRSALTEVKRLLAPGGRFLVVGLATLRSPTDHLWDVLCAVTNPVIGVLSHPRPVPGGPTAPSFPVADPTESLDEIRRVAAEVMPGAVIRRRLGFRYTLEWTRPDQA